MIELSEDASKAIALCAKWAAKLRREIACNVYLFGSAIYDNGDQFDAQLSDLDISIVFDDEIGATDRAKRVRILRKFKLEIELDLIPSLHRDNCSDPGVSILPLTNLEVEANIHKSGSRRFFDKNIFWDLISEKQIVSLPRAGISIVADEKRQAIEYSQKVRNEYLSVSANDTGGITVFDKADPIPKSLARVAAQLNEGAKEGEWYDTRLGLELLFAELARRQFDSDELQRLYRKLSKRRGGRGKKSPLDDFDQLLLAEILFDVAILSATERAIEWKMILSWKDKDSNAIKEMLNNISVFSHEYQVLQTTSEQMVLKIRSPKRNYEIVEQLSQSESLIDIFKVDSVQILTFGDPEYTTKATASRLLDEIAGQLQNWRPNPAQNLQEMEHQLAKDLHLALRSAPSMSKYMVVRDTVVNSGTKSFRVDFVIIDPKAEDEKQVVIELARIRSRQTFFQNLQRALDLPLPCVLVLLVPEETLRDIKDTIDRFMELNEKIKIIPITFAFAEPQLKK